MRTREPRSRSNRASTAAGTAKPATWPMWRGPLAYGHAGATRTVRRLGSTDDQRNFPTYGVAERGSDLRSSSAQHLLVDLGQLARERHMSIRQHLRDQGQRLLDAVGGIESDGRARVGG